MQADRVFVTLFVNDGRLDSSKAKPFYLLRSWSIEEAAARCSEVRYDNKNCFNWSSVSRLSISKSNINSHIYVVSIS